MLAIGTLLSLVVAAGASLFMAWAIGAGSSGSTPFAPAVGANAISIIRAGFLVGLLGLAGAVLQGENVTQAVGRQLVVGVSLTPLAAIVALLIAAGLVALGVFAGYPIATAFTVTGAVIGVGLALGGAPAWAKYREIVALWALTPVAGGATAFAIARLLRHPGVPDDRLVPALGALVGLLVANVGFTPLGAPGAPGSIASALGGDPWGRAVVSAVAAGLVWVGLRRAERVESGRAARQLLLALGALVAFSAGGSQVGLAIGPIVPVLEEFAVAVPLVVVLAGGGLGLLVGSWTGAPRMIKAISQDYSALGPRRSIAALVPSFVIAQAAVHYGIPVSFNEIVVSAIVGSGYAAGAASVSRSKLSRTVVAWVGSFAVALGAGYGVFLALTAVR